MASGEREPRAQLTALTGVRFLAAFHVVVFHCTRWAGWDAPGVVKSLAGNGFVAVSLFFILSGFILSYAHCAPGGPPTDRRAFYAGRFARIYPVYAFSLLLSGPFFLGHGVRTGVGATRLAVEGLAVVTLLQAHAPPLAMAWNPPAWSLSAEAFFYLLFPVLAPGLMRCRRGTALAVAAGCYALTVALPLAYLAVLPDGGAAPTYADDAFWLNALRYGPVTRAPEFVLGIVLGRLFLEPATRERLARHGGWLSVVAAGGLAVGLAAGAAVPYVLLHNGVLGPLFALLVVALAAGRGPLARLLATAPMVALGEAGYSLYILHVPVQMAARKVAVTLGGEALAASAPFTAVLLVAAVGASLLGHRFVELPLRGPARRAFLRVAGAGGASERGGQPAG